MSNESIFNIIKNFELSYLVADNLNWNRISIEIGQKKNILSTVHEYEIPHAAKQFSLIQVINATTSDVTCQAWVTRAFANSNRDESKQKKTNKPGKQRYNCKLDFCVKWISYMIFDGMSAFDLLHEMQYDEPA